MPVIGKCSPSCGRFIDHSHDYTDLYDLQNITSHDHFQIMVMKSTNITIGDKQ